MNFDKLADLLFPNITKNIEVYMQIYPRRNITGEVTRLAPSPTGFLHIGSLYGAIIDYFCAKKSNGVFYLRLEDTDDKREIAGAGQIAYDMLKYYNVLPNEGYRGELSPIGEYGPYIQSKRKEIYQAFCKELVKKGRAFPCFCEKSENKEDILQRREQQLEESGVIAERDVCRTLTYEQIEKNIKDGKPYAIRLLSMGDADKTFEFNDLIKGKRQVRQNIKDVVLLKSNGMTPYPLAHVVDDYLMGTTIVVRGEEWYPSLSQHLEIFNALSLKPMKYAHTPNICKYDEASGTKRKISKRKDPEADVRYFIEKGYMPEAIVEYLINLLNSDFEQWRVNNPHKDVLEFPFSIKKIGSNNPMFDMVKLHDVSKNVVARVPANLLADSIINWAKNYNPKLYTIIANKKDYLTEILRIDRENKKPRKDLGSYDEFESLFSYMFDELYIPTSRSFLGADKNTVKNILSQYIKLYNEGDDKQTWFDKIKSLCEPNGYCADMKTYRENPSAYKGSVADVSGIIRIAITDRENTPDLYFISKILGQDKVISRLKDTINRVEQKS